MIVAIDVDYQEMEGETMAQVAAVLFEEWGDGVPMGEEVVRIGGIEPYQPGSFYKRELPCLLAVLEQIKQPVEIVVVDGYVWLPEGKKGLGGYLYEKLDGVVVVGVAKKAFAGSLHAEKLYRGESERPLFVTAVGMEGGEAAVLVGQMDGKYRIPTLLKRVDQLCRDWH